MSLYFYYAEKVFVEENSSSPDNLLTVSFLAPEKQEDIHRSLIFNMGPKQTDHHPGTPEEMFRWLNVTIAIFTSRQWRLSSFEARRPRKLKRVKKLSCFRNTEGISYDPGAF
ncbi:hypothetical protein TNCV_3446601 [Trichonephila clavipes]|nr:hypothetical protein TNCV_3446601 [Trichonephila clavipes]